MVEPKGDFWYNLVTGKVEVGPQSDWTQLIGPYASREEAEHAIEKVHERNQAWEKGEED
jgi:hypothetical protein